MDTTAAEHYTLELINRRHRQLLVHSYIYYKMGDSIIEDSKFDQLVKETVELHNQFPDLSEQAVFWDICRGFDTSASGFFIRMGMYPDEIVSTACRLLYNVRDVQEPFEKWLKQFDLRVIKTKRKKVSK